MPLDLWLKSNQILSTKCTPMLLLLFQNKKRRGKAVLFSFRIAIFELTFRIYYLVFSHPNDLNKHQSSDLKFSWIKQLWKVSKIVQQIILKQKIFFERWNNQTEISETINYPGLKVSFSSFQCIKMNPNLNVDR